MWGKMRRLKEQNQSFCPCRVHDKCCINKNRSLVNRNWLTREYHSVLILLSWKWLDLPSHSWDLYYDKTDSDWQGHGVGNTQRTYLVGKAGPDSCWNTLLQIGVLKDDGGILAPQLQGELLAERSTQLGNPLSCGLTPSEGDQGHLWVGHQGLTYLGPCSKHNIDHTWWNTWMGNSISDSNSPLCVEDLRFHKDSPWMGEALDRFYNTQNFYGYFQFNSKARITESPPLIEPIRWDFSGAYRFTS